MSVTIDGNSGVSKIAPGSAKTVAGVDLSGTGDLQTSTFRNKIINGDMRIAQRGTLVTVLGSDTYTLDRWGALAAGANITAQQAAATIDGVITQGLVVTGAVSNTLADVFQRIEGPTVLIWLVVFVH